MQRDVCYICGNKNRDVLEQHHIVPRRFGGSDDEENLVQLCSNCHTSLERLYDKRFYETLGVEKPEPESESAEVCHHSGCASTNTTRFENNGAVVYACSHHRFCDYGSRCMETDTELLSTINGERPVFRCRVHSRCSKPACSAKGSSIAKFVDGYEAVCSTHNPERQSP